MDRICRAKTAPHILSICCRAGKPPHRNEKTHALFCFLPPLSPQTPRTLSSLFTEPNSDLNGGTREGEGHSPRQRKNSLFLCLVGHIFGPHPLPLPVIRGGVMVAHRKMHFCEIYFACGLKKGT